MFAWTKVLTQGAGPQPSVPVDTLCDLFGENLNILATSRAQGS